MQFGEKFIPLLFDMTAETIGHAVWLALTDARSKICTAIVPLIPIRILDSVFE